MHHFFGVVQKVEQIIGNLFLLYFSVVLVEPLKAWWKVVTKKNKKKQIIILECLFHYFFVVVCQSKSTLWFKIKLISGYVSLMPSNKEAEMREGCRLFTSKTIRKSRLFPIDFARERTSWSAGLASGCKPIPTRIWHKWGHLLINNPFFFKIKRNKKIKIYIKKIFIKYILVRV